LSFYNPPRVLGFGFHLTFHLTPSVHIPIFRSPHTTSTWGRLFLSLDSFVIDRSTIFPRGYRLSLFIAIAIAVVVPLISNLGRRLRINSPSSIHSSVLTGLVPFLPQHIPPRPSRRRQDAFDQWTPYHLHSSLVARQHSPIDSPQAYKMSTDQETVFGYAPSASTSTSLSPGDIRNCFCGNVIPDGEGIYCSAGTCFISLLITYHTSLAPSIPRLILPLSPATACSCCYRYPLTRPLETLC